MGAIRRFNAFEDENSVFRFTIDTTKIVSGATNGSENPLTFRIPSRQLATNSAIVKVSDGRPDISITSATTDFNLTFASAGIYNITIIGRLWFSFSAPTFLDGFDKLKIILISVYPGFGSLQSRCFRGCSNLVINSVNTLVLPSDSSYFFNGIKEIQSSLLNVDTSKVTNATQILNFIQNDLKSTFNPFFESLTLPNNLYSSLTFSSDVDKIEIKSNAMTRLYQMFNSITFKNTGTIDLICDTPNVTQLYRLLYNGDVRTRCHAGKVDVRSVTDTDQWLNGVLSTAQVDATLLGWANNLPYMQSGVTWNWNGSKYSNSPAVIAAYNKITNDWGVIFTNLTME